jgi:poly [ADP-ribose] polymerase 2/3/4
MSAHIHLRMVTGQNNNKDYIMTDNDDGTFTAEWGRYGVGRMQHKSYPLAQWDGKMNEKLRKGYRDVTSYTAAPLVKPKRNGGFQLIAEPAIAEVFDNLMRRSKATLAANYEVGAEVVTQKQLDDAQELIDRLSKVKNTRSMKEFHDFNQFLIDLFHVIPRRMHNVQDHLWSDVNDQKAYNHIVQREQDLLDTMSGQVNVIAAQQESPDEEQTLLEAIGIDVRPCNTQEFREIKAIMQRNHRRVQNAFRVTHQAQQRKFDQHLACADDKRRRLLWHGSRTENWISILQESLKIRPSTAVLTGAMFGNGVYFSPMFQKSLGYTSVRDSYWAHGAEQCGYLGVFDVHTGVEYEVNRWDGAMSSLDWNRLRREGDYDSLHAKSGYDLRNPEIIVYRVEQCAIKYLVEVN